MTSTKFLKKNGRGRKRDKRIESNCLNDIILGPDAEDSDENDLDYDDAELNGGLEMEVVSALAPASHHKGLARKVLPNVIGLLNSRMLSLWRFFFFILFFPFKNKTKISGDSKSFLKIIYFHQINKKAIRAIKWEHIVLKCEVHKMTTLLGITRGSSLNLR
ncbi:hypothetical protein PVL29_006397 [Vitis rotundifolia]|uniref:Uncharacterized protein n=1 Tax=Vitis rotundifolia TaxID=103349 RepID=A0AA39A527_VITRO|nr:hypothetical protein PVL29_006397 [Vitis rotundifolia]